MMTPGRLEVGLVGTAPELAIMGLALAGAGHFPWVITEPAPADRERVVSMLRGVAIRPAAEVVAATQLIIIGAGEGETVAKIVESLADAWKPGQIVLHTSAEHGIGVLEPASRKGAIPLAIHPVLTFTGTSLDLHRMKDAHFAVTAPDVALPIALALVVEMGGEPFVIAEDDRAAYADAIATVAEFSRAIVDQSTFRLQEIGVEHPGAVLRALAHSAVEEALRASSDGAIDPIGRWLDETTAEDDD
jgi:predicted short-subunit dehydrogenase-like oxidoreductase (DUF2520 family)